MAFLIASIAYPVTGFHHEGMKNTSCRASLAPRPSRPSCPSWLTIVDQRADGLPDRFDRLPALMRSS
jgi:hypothetical protein